MNLLPICPALLLLGLAACSSRTVSKKSAGDTGPKAPLPTENHFRQADSGATPFLAAFADGNIPWQPWSQAALDAAAASHRPILLHVGYSTCPFTRRLRQTVLSDPKLETFLAENFVCVLVDSEDNTAVNSLMLACLPHMGNVPAWPMLIWMDAAGRPFHSHQFTRKNAFSPAAILATAETALSTWGFENQYATRLGEEVLGKGFPAPGPPPAVAPTPAALLDEAYHLSIRVYDAGYGTLSAGQNFPRPNAIQLLLALADVFPADSFRRQEMLDAAGTCLRRMREGAILDPLDHTFHRYSEKPNWDAPHSEKLLTDQALIATAYLDGANRLGDPSFRATAFVLLDAVLADWKLPGGLFLHAKTAFVPPDWTAPPPFLAPWFTWSAAEIRDLLDPEEERAVFLFHGIRERGNMPPSLYSPLFKDRGNVLTTALPVEKAAASLSLEPARLQSLLATAHEKLRAARQARPGAMVDDRATVVGNALLLAALARAAAEPGGDRFHSAAADLDATLRQKALAPDYRLNASGWWQDHPIATPPSHLDYAALLDAMISWQERTKDPAAIPALAALQSSIESLFPAGDAPGFPSYPGNVLLPITGPVINMLDSATPSDNALTAGNLRRLAALTGNPAYLESRAGVLAMLARNPGELASAQSLLRELALDHHALSPTAGPNASGSPAGAP